MDVVVLEKWDLITEFVARRMYYSSGTWNRPPNSHAVLLDKYWIKLQMGTMSREELKKVNVFLKKNPLLTLKEAKERKRLSVAMCWRVIDGAVQPEVHLPGRVPWFNCWKFMKRCQLLGV